MIGYSESLGPRFESWRAHHYLFKRSDYSPGLRSLVSMYVHHASESRVGTSGLPRPSSTTCQIGARALVGKTECRQALIACNSFELIRKLLKLANPFQVVIPVSPARHENMSFWLHRYFAVNASGRDDQLLAIQLDIGQRRAAPGAKASRMAGSRKPKAGYLVLARLPPEFCTGGKKIRCVGRTCAFLAMFAMTKKKAVEVAVDFETDFATQA
jgi:hypothetical protein